MIESSSSERPLVTFALFAYNQEKYILEAIEGAFSQSYQPLEIILSDDYSSDRTFTLMQGSASTYRGPHKVILNRNESNLGTANHINAVMKLARGELVVVAAGDDISIPERTIAIAQRWLEKPQIDSVYSGYRDIDERGVMCGLHVDGGVISGVQFISQPNMMGATGAWTKRIFREFGPIRYGAVCEDRVIPFRALLNSRLAYIPEPLVLYRSRDRNRDVAFEFEMARDVWHLRKRDSLWILGSLKNHETDLLTIGLAGREACYDHVRKQIAYETDRREGYLSDVRYFSKLVKVARFYLRYGWSDLARSDVLRALFPWIFKIRSFIRAVYAKSRIRKAI